MGKLTIEEVKHVAKLAKLELTDSEIKKFDDQLSSIVDFVGELSKVDTDGIEPTSQTTGLENVFRVDELKPSEIHNAHEATSGTDNTKNNYFVVPAVIDKD